MCSSRQVPSRYIVQVDTILAESLDKAVNIVLHLCLPLHEVDAVPSLHVEYSLWLSQLKHLSVVKIVILTPSLTNSTLEVDTYKLHSSKCFIIDSLHSEQLVGGDSAERGIPLLLSISQLSIGQIEITSSEVFWAIFLASLRTFHQKSEKKGKIANFTHKTEICSYTLL